MIEGIASIHAYSVGICHMSVCVPGELSRDQIESWANTEYPTGISSQWQITEPKFKTGDPNPCPCNREHGRWHYLLTC